MGGTLRADEFTGRRGIVSQISTDGDVEIDYGRTLWVFHQRLRPVDRAGTVGTSHNDRTFGI
jgi:hypothetical protein